MLNIIKIIIIISFCIVLYIKKFRQPKIKIVKSPKPEDIKRQRKKERTIRKMKRRFKIPYRGKTQITEFDKTKPYIESAWNEIEHHK